MYCPWGSAIHRAICETAATGRDAIYRVRGIYANAPYLAFMPMYHVRNIYADSATLHTTTSYSAMNGADAVNGVPTYHRRGSMRDESRGGDDHKSNGPSKIQ